MTHTTTTSPLGYYVAIPTRHGTHIGQVVAETLTPDGQRIVTVETPNGHRSTHQRTDLGL